MQGLKGQRCESKFSCVTEVESIEVAEVWPLRIKMFAALELSQFFLTN